MAVEGIAAIASYFGASASAATAIGGAVQAAVVVGSAAAASDSSRKAAHAQSDALKAQTDFMNRPLTATPIMPLADDKATQAKRQQTIIAAQNNALLTGNNRAGTILTSDKLGG